MSPDPDTTQPDKDARFRDLRFQKHLMSPTALEVLLRGHLWVEAELISTLEDVLPFPDQIDLTRLSFPLKVTLVAAHGFIRPDDVPAFLKLNSLRNKMAHNLHDEPNEEAVNDLINTFGNYLRHMYGSTFAVMSSRSLARVRASA